jgi:general stress protein 26
MTHQTGHRITIRTVLQPLLLLRGNQQVTTIHLTTKATHSTLHFSRHKALQRLYNQEVEISRQEQDQAMASHIMLAALARHLTTHRQSTQTLWEEQVVLL